MPNDEKTKAQPSQQAQPLLTTKSLALSLSAPRAPPYESAHRQVLLGKDPARAAWSRNYSVKEFRSAKHGVSQKNSGSSHGSVSSFTDKQQEAAHSFYPHDTLRQRIVDCIRHSHADTPRRIHRHPHLPAGPELGDQITRSLGLWLSHSTTNHLRDSGYFRTICDSLVTLSAPLVGLSNRTTAYRFVQLTKQRRCLVYGLQHPRQYLDLYVPEDDSYLPPSRLIVFLHGGAWGSGMPWMYRLCAHPFLEKGWVVAIPSYRTYPDGKAVDQVQDAEAALSFLQHKFPQYCQHVTLMGHSSGAHIGLLLLAERAKQKFEQGQIPATNNNLLPIDVFVGLSGPYDISHHFDYEAARGVEELSPMKAACGMTREGFRLTSPALRLLDSLSTLTSEGNVAKSLPSHMLLLHAIEDETVPFTSTAEAARVLRSCGVQQCQEYYVGPGTSHQDTVMQLMVGGPSCEAVLSWLQQVVPYTTANVKSPPTLIKSSSKL